VAEKLDWKGLKCNLVLICFLHFSYTEGLFYSRALLNVDCSGVHQVAYLFDFQAVRYCISAAFFAILWDLHHLEEVMENGANGTEQLQLLKTRLHMFMDTMKELLMSGQNQTYVEEVSEEKLKLLLRWRMDHRN
jgi:hypothetical protein